MERGRCHGNLHPQNLSLLCNFAQTQLLNHVEKKQIYPAGSFRKSMLPGDCPADPTRFNEASQDVSCCRPCSKQNSYSEH